MFINCCNRVVCLFGYNYNLNIIAYVITSLSRAEHICTGNPGYCFALCPSLIAKFVIFYCYCSCSLIPLIYNILLFPPSTPPCYPDKLVNHFDQDSSYISRIIGDKPTAEFLILNSCYYMFSKYNFYSILDTIFILDGALESLHNDWLIFII